MTTNSQTFCPNGPCPPRIFFYQAIQISVSVGGSYVMACNSSFVTVGLLYDLNNFNPTSVFTYLLTSDPGLVGENGQFVIEYIFKSMTQYTLVAAAYFWNVTGPFTIKAFGPGSVSFTNILIA